MTIDSSPIAPLRPRPLWDLLTTLIGIGALLTMAAPLMSGMGCLMLLGVEACDVQDCNSTALNLALGLGIVGPWVAAVVTSALGGILLACRRLGFWAPAAGFVGVAVVEVAAFLVAQEVTP